MDITKEYHNLSISRFTRVLMVSRVNLGPAWGLASYFGAQPQVRTEEVRTMGDNVF